MDGNATLCNTTSGTGCNNTGPGLGPDGYFGFSPNIPLEIFATVLYFVLTIGVLYKNIKHRTWFMMPIVIGGLLECFGFCYRTWETYNLNSEVGFILYLVPVLVAPTILAAGDYGLASVIMIRGNVRVRFFTPKKTKYLFLICDIAAFFIQGIGGSVAGTSKDASQARLGSNIVLVGLGISLAVFIIFLIIAFILHIKIRASSAAGANLQWQGIFYVIYVNMICLSIRALYRVAEFQGGSTKGALSVDEAYFYVLDVVLMMILIASWIPFHPSHFGLTKEETAQEVAAYEKENAGDIPV